MEYPGVGSPHSSSIPPAHTLGNELELPWGWCLPHLPAIEMSSIVRQNGKATSYCCPSLTAWESMSNLRKHKTRYALANPKQVQDASSAFTRLHSGQMPWLRRLIMASQRRHRPKDCFLILPAPPSPFPRSKLQAPSSKPQEPDPVSPHPSRRVPSDKWSTDIAGRSTRVGHQGCKHYGQNGAALTRIGGKWCDTCTPGADVTSEVCLFLRGSYSTRTSVGNGAGLLCRASREKSYRQQLHDPG